MNHKLQNFPPKTNGLDTAGHLESPSSTSQIPNDDASGSGFSTADKCPPPSAAADGIDVAFVDNVDAESLDQTPGGRPDPRLPDALRARCEVARSAGYDPTGERAVACGAAAVVVCEHCGPMCAGCAAETFCYWGEHELSALVEEQPPRSRRYRRPVSQVVYVEIKCPNCRRVRLALPQKHRVKARRKCPVCRREGPAEYLAHGFTRRRLPYHEVFEVAEPNDLTILPGGKRRVPWDVRDLADYKEE